MGIDENPYRAPASERDDEEALNETEPTLASRRLRFAAAFIDVVLELGATLPLQFKAGMFDGYPRMHPLSPVKTVLWGGVGVAVYLVLNGYLLGTNAQSIGKRLCGIRIVNVSDGQRTPFSRLLLLRLLPMWVMQLIPVVGRFGSLLEVLLIFRADRRCLHDHIAGTVVVKD